MARTKRVVAVGCPHRLRQSIGERTARPCAACAPIGPPGWPRYAWAMTVDYGSPLARMAPPVPDPVAPMPEALRRVLGRLRETAREVGVVAQVSLGQAISDLVDRTRIEHGPLNIVVAEQTHDFVSASDRASGDLRVCAHDG